MRRFNPSTPFSVAMKLLVPTTTTVKGTLKKVYSDPEDSETFFGSFKTFGGSEALENGIYSVVDTATIETWYRPDIKADCAIYICETGAIYEIKGTPEDINMRHQYLTMRTQRIGGGA